MRAARVLAQAKINLFLQVGARDESGYHDVWTVFHRIDLADEVIVRLAARERTLDVGGPRMPVGGLGPVEKNLAYRAAMAYAAHTGWQFPRGFVIEVTKNIPVGGGLGGGSADAGAVLRALDALAPSPMDPVELHRVAASLGADVPFLTSDAVSASAIGRGDHLTPIPSQPAPATVVLVVPYFSIATADAYGWLDEDRAETVVREIDSEAPSTALVESPWFSRSGNDFEPVIEKRFPQLEAMRSRLIDLGARTARLAGSGSCVFGIFEHSPPDPRDVELDALVLVTRTSSRVVQVEVLE